MTDFAPLTLETPAEHPFAQFVRILGKGKRGARNLTRELQACWPPPAPRRQVGANPASR